MWGSADHKGLIAELDEEEWTLVNEMLREKVPTR